MGDAHFRTTIPFDNGFARAVRRCRLVSVLAVSREDATMAPPDALNVRGNDGEPIPADKIAGHELGPGDVIYVTSPPPFRLVYAVVDEL